MANLFEKININKILKYLLFIFLTLVTQNMVFTQVRIFGVCPMVLPAAAVAVGMFEGVGAGAVFSVVLGAYADMAFIENTILFTALLPGLSFAAGFVAQFFVNRRFFAFMGITLAAQFITAMIQMLKTLAGNTWGLDMAFVVIVQTLISLPPSALAYFPPARWIK